MSFLRWKPQDSVAVEHQERFTTFIEYVAVSQLLQQRPVSLDAWSICNTTLGPGVSWTSLLWTVQGCSIWRRSPSGGVMDVPKVPTRMPSTVPMSESA